MITAEHGVLPRIDVLRDEFDASFARAPCVSPARTMFLGVRVGGDPYALRMLDIASLHRDRKLVPLIGEVPHFLGIAGFRGNLAPVYDLGVLLGYPGAPIPRWLVLTRAPSPVGLAFDLYESHLIAVPDEISSTKTLLSKGGESPEASLEGVVSVDGVARPIISISSVLEVIVRRFRKNDPEKER